MQIILLIVFNLFLIKNTFAAEQPRQSNIPELEKYAWSTGFRELFPTIKVSPSSEPLHLIDKTVDFKQLNNSDSNSFDEFFEKESRIRYLLIIRNNVI